MTVKKQVGLTMALAVIVPLVGCAESPTTPDPTGAAEIRLAAVAEDVTPPSFVSLSFAPVAINTTSDSVRVVG